MVKTLTRAAQSAIAWSLLGISAASASVEIVYTEPTSKQEQQAKQAIIDSEVNLLLVELSEQYFPFKTPLTVSYGGEDGPLYDPANHTMMMPYHFYSEALDYFTKNDYQEKYDRAPELGAIDTILHTLLHEAGHAYIEDQSIPVLGKEEDAVDNFAVVMMLEYVEDGDNAAISAADMFAFESQDRPDYYAVDEYIDEHSFDLQRYFSTLCLIYGSDPEKHSNLLDEIGKESLADRKDFCISHYQTINSNWHTYLKNHSKTYF
ncbi:DUF4344 domain-containing metallopeptidase [Vibrio panuliri]|uniref:Metallopeptidase DUF4344 n=1 Tax=Vibrio panuliri TaxID=1381081 RepID=A0ABX3FN66_9VIBR|nr:DUF4344 domain-containing metallopeptidase [Vibrio panuliri]KAB1458033.1 hypothetical protein F7O85_09975 [Vibrio panuliri]OLQ95483.1 hypothetical protein BIY20_21075 [Vibrio panuliri]